MLKHFMVGLAVVVMMGFGLGCDQPPEGPGNGGGFEQPSERNTQEQQPGQREPGGFE